MTATTTGGKSRASTSALDLGEHSIDRAKPREVGDEVWLDWTIRLHDGRVLRKRSKAATKGEVRRRAKKKAKELLEVSANENWKRSDSFVDYIEKVSRPIIENGKLAKSTRERYRTALNYLEGKCRDDDHVHERSLKGLSIANGIRFRILEQCLIEIADLHGAMSAHHARTVLGKYVLDQMIRDELIEASPIAGKRIDLSGKRKKGDSDGKSQAVALTIDQWNACVNYLLEVDVAKGVERPRRGMYTLEDRIAVRHNAIDLTLLQAVTGLRISEATKVDGLMVKFSEDEMVLDLSPRFTKTKKGRVVHVKEPGAIERFRKRSERARSKRYPLVGSPAKPAVVWDSSQRNDAVKEIYLELSRELGIELLQTKRSHVWRATVNTLTKQAGVDESIRVAHLGHTAKVNRDYYTDDRDGAALADALLQLRTATGTRQSTQSDRDSAVSDDPQ